MDAVHACRARHRHREQVFDCGARQACDPLWAFVHFNQQRQFRPDDGTEVMDVAVEPLVPGQLESRREQRALCGGCVRHQQIQVSVGPHRRIGVVRGRLRALDQDDRSVANVTDLLEHESSRREPGTAVVRRSSISSCDTGAPCFRPAMGGKKMKPVSDQPIEVGRTVDQLVDAAPEVVATGVDLRDRRLGGASCCLLRATPSSVEAQCARDVAHGERRSGRQRDPATSDAADIGASSSALIVYSGMRSDARRR